MLISVTVNASLVTLCIISLDRFNTLSKPFESRAGLTFTKRHHKLIIACSWIHSVFWAGAPLYGWGSVTLDTYTHTCKPDWGAGGAVNRSYATCLAMFAFTLPVVLMIYAYFKIYRIARSSREKFSYDGYGSTGGRHKTVARYAAEGKGKDEDEDTRSTSSRVILSCLHSTDQEHRTVMAEENKALKTVFLLIGSFAACWALYTVVTMWKFAAPNSLPAWIVRAGLVLALCHCLIDPLIYSIRDTKLKRELKDLLLSFAAIKNPAESNDGGN